MGIDIGQTTKFKLKFDNAKEDMLFAVQGDTGRVINVQVLSESNETIDVTGFSLDFYIGNANETTKVGAELESPSDGKFKIQIENTQLKYPGIQKAQFVLKDEEGKKIGSRIFDIYVEESIENGAIEGKNLILNFDEIFDSIQVIKQSNEFIAIIDGKNELLASTVNEAETKNTELESTLDRADSETGKINQMLVDSSSERERIETAINNSVTAKEALEGTTAIAEQTDEKLKQTTNDAVTKENSLKETIEIADTNISTLTGKNTESDGIISTLQELYSDVENAKKEAQAIIASGNLDQYVNDVELTQTLSNYATQEFVENKLPIPVDNLISTDAELPLSANQGKILNDKITILNGKEDKDTVTTINGKTGAITKEDIVALGIPASDTNTTYSVATTSANGLMSSADKGKLDGIESNAQKNTVTSVQGRTGAVTISKNDLGLGSVENIGIKILTQAQYDGLSFAEKARTDILYAISG